MIQMTVCLLEHSSILVCQETGWNVLIKLQSNHRSTQLTKQELKLWLPVAEIKLNFCSKSGNFLSQKDHQKMWLSSETAGTGEKQAGDFLLIVFSYFTF